jgi:hypothetical protein
MSFYQDNSVLNCNSNTSNTYLQQLNLFLPFPVDFGDVFTNQPTNNTNPGSSPDPLEPQLINMGPGLYAIVCSKTGKIYFGESENLLYRLGMHYKELVKGKHECKQLQEDWNSHGLANISFVSLSVGPEWDNTTTLRNAETKLIKQNLNIVYNLSIAGSVPKQNSDIYKKTVSYKGTSYPSIAAASRGTCVSETHIRRLLRDPQNNDWLYPVSLNNLDNKTIVNMDKAKPILVHGAIYRSIREASKVTKISRHTLLRHLE